LAAENVTERLLGRDSFPVDLEIARDRIRGSIVLVTGAAGSIGSSICFQLAQHDPHTIIAVDHNGPAMTRLERKLSEIKGDCHAAYYTADICDKTAMEEVFAKHHPMSVFHAAASKYIPPMEHDVPAAIRNNILGLFNLLQVAAARDCQDFVLISSDKAVNPRSVVGVTKRVGELILSRYPSRMRTISVRLGNVLASSGSVVPIFLKQLCENQPLTITDAAAERYFISFTEAIGVILAAVAVGESGDTLVLDMGEPVRITDLARRVIQICGKREQEVTIRFIGLRPGEKLSEDLLYDAEHAESTAVARVRRVRNNSGGWQELEARLAKLFAALDSDDASSLRRKLQEIVPEYIVHNS